MTSHPHPRTDETEPPFKVSKESKLTTNVGVIIALCAAVWIASQKWNGQSDVVAEHTRQLTMLQSTVGALTDQVRSVSSKQDSQTELLKYIARDRRGPVPDSAK